MSKGPPQRNRCIRTYSAKEAVPCGAEKYLETKHICGQYNPLFRQTSPAVDPNQLIEMRVSAALASSAGCRRAAVTGV